MSILASRRLFAGVVLGTATCLAALVEPLPAQTPAPERGAYVVRLGRDTIAAERFTRTAERLEGRLVVRAPRTATRDYVATLAPDGRITRYEVRYGQPGVAAPNTHAVADLSGDTAVVRIEQGDSVRTLRIAAPRGAVPLLGNSFALYDQATRQARAAGQDSVALAFVPLGASATSPLSVRRLRGDSIRLTTYAGPMRARVDAAGRLLMLDGTGSTAPLLVERANTLDLEALTTAWLAREQQGQAMGQLSPRDSLQATFGGATVTVNYGRPAKRGRTVFGELVPWNVVWRTGANQATHLRTDRDLMIGGAHVPAGSYTLFSLPTPEGWTLIINKQTGQWGTQYDAAQDLARVPMRRETLSTPMEQFTIGIEPQGQGALLWLAWDDTRASVPVVGH